MAKKGKKQRPILRKEKGRIVLVSAFDAELMSAYSDGAEFFAEPMPKRSLPLQRFYWLCLSRCVAATGVKPTAEKLHDALMWECGFVSVETDLQGRPHLVRDSTSFDAMTTDAEFRPVFDEVMKRLSEAVGYDVTSADPSLIGAERKAA